MVVESAFFIAFFAGKSIALRSKATEAGFPIWREFFPVHGSPSRISDHNAAAEGILQVELLGRLTVIGVGNSETQDCHAPLVLPHVNTIVRGGLGGTIPAVVFEYGIDVVRNR